MSKTRSLLSVTTAVRTMSGNSVEAIVVRVTKSMDSIQLGNPLFYFADARDEKISVLEIR